MRRVLTGATGVNSFTATTAAFTAPASGSNVNISVTATRRLDGGRPDVFIGGGAGYYQVVTAGATRLTVKNLGYPGNADLGHDRRRIRR